MIEIQLNHGKVAFIDDADYPLVSQYKWYAKCDHETHWTAATSIERGKGKGTLRMHQLLGYWGGDHRNRNGLDNRRSNLRPATHQQNMCNVAPNRNAKSKYKGVSLHNPRQVWRARIQVNHKEIMLGIFHSEQEAALAYDNAARQYHGEFAWLNAQHFPDDFV
jgi:hypothetical protein